MATTPKKTTAPRGGRLKRDEVLHRVNTVLPVDIYMRLLADAKAGRRSLAQQFAHALEQYLNRQEAA